MINISKKSALTLTVLMLISMNLSAFNQAIAPAQNDSWLNFSFLDGAKDNAKFAAWLATSLAIAYYFLHYPEDRPSGAPFERVIKGYYNNIMNDTFNWDNINNLFDIFPGQRGKVYSTILDGRKGFKIKLFFDERRKDIRGFGLLYFMEKDWSKLLRLTASLGVTYALMTGKAKQTIAQIAALILDPYGYAKAIAQTGEAIPVNKIA